MKKYVCSYPFSGTLICEIEANSLGEAQLLAESAFDNLTPEEVLQNAQFGHIEIAEE